MILLLTELLIQQSIWLLYTRVTTLPMVNLNAVVINMGGY